MNSSRGTTVGGRSRRRLLSAAGVALTTGFAGCFGALEEGAEDPAADETESTDATRESGETSASADPYRMHQYGPAHVGSTADAGPTSDVDAVWTFREGADDSYYEIGTPAIVDGTVYVAEGRSVDEEGAETVVYALDGATSEIEWTYSGTDFFGATVVDGTVFFPSAGLHALRGTRRPDRAIRSPSVRSRRSLDSRRRSPATDPRAIERFERRKVLKFHPPM